MGLTWSNSYHLILMALPNILNPYKLYRNLKHPFYETIHTQHKQYPLEEKSGIHVVEHRLFGKLLTVDLIEKNKEIKGLTSRVRRLFSRDFYYGHCEYFPHSFRLINRTYVRDKQFSLEDHIRKVLSAVAPLFK